MADWSDTATAEDIAGCFRLILGRAPSAAEWAAHTAALVGQPLTLVAKNYLQSAEFAGRQMIGPVPGALVLAAFEGVRVYAAPDDYDVGRHVAAGSYQPGLACVFRQYLRPGMTVLDVGANIGAFTMLAASLVGPGGHVLAVEPNEGNVRLIEASRRANGFAQVAIAFCAAGPGPGLLGLQRASSNGIAIPLAADLDAFLREPVVPSFPLAMILPAHPIDFIKIDVEGAEHTALLSMEAALRRDRPVIVTEFSPALLPRASGVDAQGYAAFLLGLNYRVAAIAPNGSIEGCPDVPAIMAAFGRSGETTIDLLLTS